MAGKVKKLTEQETCGCIANTQLPRCACRRVHGRIGKDCVLTVSGYKTELTSQCMSSDTQSQFPFWILFGSQNGNRA